MGFGYHSIFQLLPVPYESTCFVKLTFFGSNANVSVSPHKMPIDNNNNEKVTLDLYIFEEVDDSAAAVLDLGPG